MKRKPTIFSVHVINKMSALMSNMVCHIFCFLRGITVGMKATKNRFLIVGYYEIGYSQRIHGRTAIRAKNLHFVPVEHAYEITDKRWEQIKPPGAKKLTSMRQATQRITDNLIDEILQHLADRQNRVR